MSVLKSTWMISLYMPYGHTFLKALENLEKVLTQCQETNLSLSDAKF
jgi:hypothetical protein